MEVFILKLAVAAIPLLALVVSVTIASKFLVSSSHHSLSWHRTRRCVLKSMAAGVMLR